MSFSQYAGGLSTSSWDDVLACAARGYLHLALDMHQAFSGAGISCALLKSASLIDCCLTAEQAGEPDRSPLGVFFFGRVSFHRFTKIDDAVPLHAHQHRWASLDDLLGVCPLCKGAARTLDG